MITWTGNNLDAIMPLIREARAFYWHVTDKELRVITAHGMVKAEPGDWLTVQKGVLTCGSSE